LEDGFLGSRIINDITYDMICSRSGGCDSGGFASGVASIRVMDPFRNFMRSNYAFDLLKYLEFLQTLTFSEA